MMEENKSLSPCARLLVEKQHLRTQCQLQEERILGDWHYIKKHAGKFLRMELSSILLNSSGASKNSGSSHHKVHEPHSFTSLIWGVAKPVLFRWAIHKGIHTIKKIFKRKKE